MASKKFVWTVGLSRPKMKAEENQANLPRIAPSFQLALFPKGMKMTFSSPFSLSDLR